MPRTTDFQIDPNDLTFADGSQLSALVIADIESDAEGTYFKLTGLKWEGMRVDAKDWRWAAVSEWVAQDVRNIFGVVWEGWDAANKSSPAADRADFRHDERLNTRAA